MKKNWFLRIGLISLVLALATTCLLGGTFAKYTTTVSGSDSIQVARFAFKAADVDGIELENDGAVIQPVRRCQNRCHRHRTDRHVRPRRVWHLQYRCWITPAPMSMSLSTTTAK